MRSPPPRSLRLLLAHWVTLSNTETGALCHTWAPTVLHYREEGNGKTLAENHKPEPVGAAD